MEGAAVLVCALNAPIKAKGTLECYWLEPGNSEDRWAVGCLKEDHQFVSGTYP